MQRVARRLKSARLQPINGIVYRRVRNAPMANASSSSDLLVALQEAAHRTITPPVLSLNDAALAKFLGACHRRRYPSKTPIFRPGDNAGILYYIIEGSLA